MALDLRDLARRAAELGGEEAIASVSLRRELLVRCSPTGPLLPPRRTFDLLVRLLVRDGAGRVGVARCSTSTAPEQLIVLAEQAHANAATSMTNLTPLPQPSSAGHHAGFDARTADLNPVFGAARAREAASQIGGDRAVRRLASWRAERVDVAVASAAGTVVADARTGVQLRAVAADVDGRVAAWSQASGVIADTIDAYRAGLRATPVLDRFAAPPTAAVGAPSDHVVLLAPALAPLIDALAGMAATGHAVATGLSPFTGRAGMPVASRLLTIDDDPGSPATLARGVDVEGVAGVRVALLREGTAGGVVHDTASADEVGAASTGHAAELGGGAAGARPRNLVVRGGTADGADALLTEADRCTVIAAISRVQLAGPGSTRFTAFGHGAYRAQGGAAVALLGDVALSGDLVDIVENVRSLSSTTELVATLDRLPERTSSTTCPAALTTGLAVFAA